jgi:UDP-glucuronate 4-epimerase
VIYGDQALSSGFLLAEPAGWPINHRMKVLVTGAAGFVGHHLARRLAESGKCEVLGVDDLGGGGEELKRARLALLEPVADFRFVRADFAKAAEFAALVAAFKPDYVAHLGARTGVRASLEDPAPYVHSNLDGFASLLEACRRVPPRHLVYASSSSVYGAGARAPFREDDDTSQPVSFYGATKKCNEVMAHSYARTHGLRATGLRFFTVYGPWGRPDMAPTLFARAILEGRPIPLFNEGRNRRDFTYVDDIVAGIVKVLLHPGPASPPADAPGGAVYNLGQNRPVETLLLVRMLETLLGRTARVELLPAQPGEMIETCADLTRVQAAYGFTPKVPLEEGLRRFVEWFKERHDRGLS